MVKKKKMYTTFFYILKSNSFSTIVTSVTPSVYIAQLRSYDVFTLKRAATHAVKLGH